MGAVTSLLYGAEDPSIAGMVLDSAFSNLYNLMMELVDVYKIRLPKFTVKMAVQYMRRVIEKKAKFDIMKLNCILVAPKTFIPVLFGHASDEKFIQPRHSDLISESYVGDKNIIKFDGDHNSSRPQFFYDSVSIFFYNVLRPPQVSIADKLEKYYDLGDLKLGSGVDESVLYEILSSLRSATTDAASSSSAFPTVSATKSVTELLSEVGPLTDVDPLFGEETKDDNDGIGHDEAADVQVKLNGHTEDCCSYTSSNRESWGRCSSLGGSDQESCDSDTYLYMYSIYKYIFVYLWLIYILSCFILYIMSEHCEVKMIRSTGRIKRRIKLEKLKRNRRVTHLRSWRLLADDCGFAF
ncbi:uncharacterized protein [Cicer arietinum]|nr:uncharacterized protein LOC101501041 isoform X7 [Cicer arietinum]